MLLDYKIIYMDLPIRIKGFVKETDGFFDIVLNQNLSYEQNVQSFFHELIHIENDDFSKFNVQLIEYYAHYLQQ